MNVRTLPVRFAERVRDCPADEDVTRPVRAPSGPVLSDRALSAGAPPSVAEGVRSPAPSRPVSPRAAPSAARTSSGPIRVLLIRGYLPAVALPAESVPGACRCRTGQPR